MFNISRRDFLKLARDGFLYLSGALALGGLLRFLDYDPNPAPPTEFDLVPPQIIPFTRVRFFLTLRLCYSIPKADSLP